MSLQTEVELLRRVTLFAHIDTTKLKLLAFTSERLTYGEGQALFHEGDLGDGAYLILDGEVDVLRNSDSGLILVNHLVKHSLVGEMSILCDVPRTANVVATMPVDALKIRKETFFQLLKEVPQLALEIMRELARRLNHTNDELVAARAALKARSGA
ncbi:MAG TPA: cyclic nucleotide-binding protein [Alphaproteobacteria bacterium]|nr:cyclic nucleotide-binding protein [Alphaproteobacteria bacterium]